jgi:cephalosporin-C deacetylase-like acetyl esterase
MKLALTFVLLLSAAPLLAQDTDLLRRFDYDKKAPLEVKESAVERRGEIAIHDITYASPKGGRVPAYLVVPQGRSPFAAVIWGHWYICRT